MESPSVLLPGWSHTDREYTNTSPSHKTDSMEANLSATFDAGSSFNTKLRDTLQGLLSANNERKSEIDALRGDHDTLKKDHDALVNTTERENDLRKNEIKSLEERQQKDNQNRITDIAKLDGKLDSENSARKEEIKALDGWAKSENDSRKKEIADLKNFAETENDARKTHIANLENFAKSENDARKADIAELTARTDGGLDMDTGIFTCPTGGTYLFMFHIATHDNKKALLSIRKNGEEIASIFDQNHKDNHKNSMAG